MFLPLWRREQLKLNFNYYLLAYGIIGKVNSYKKIMMVNINNNG